MLDECLETGNNGITRLWVIFADRRNITPLCDNHFLMKLLRQITKADDLLCRFYLLPG